MARSGGALSPGTRAVRPGDVEEHFPDGSETFQLEEEGLSRLQLILRYATDDDGAPVTHRAALVEGLALALKEEPGSADALPAAVQLLEELLSEEQEEELVHAAASQIAPLAEALQQEPDPAPREEAAGRLLSALASLLLEGGAPEEVQAASVDAVPRVANCLPGGAADVLLGAAGAGDGLLASLAEEDDEELRATAARLVPGLAACYPPELVEQRIVELYAPLLDDEDFDVRKDAVASLGGLAEHLPRASVEAFVMPSFVKASQDEIQFVRMECASALPRMAQILGPEGAPMLAEAADRLLTDKSRWVLHEARMQIGAFSQCPACAGLSEVLLGEFQRMMLLGEHGEMELQEAVRAASDLPSMAAKLGADWWAQLGEGVERLCASKKATLRAALSRTLHLLAAASPSPSSQEKLSEVFLRLLADQDRLVTAGLIEGLGDLLAILPGPCWGACVEQLPSMAPPQGVNVSGWRTRLHLTKQLEAIAGCGDRRAVLEGVMPFAFQLCRDPVAVVRSAAAEQAAHIFCVAAGIGPHLEPEVHSGRGSAGGGGPSLQPGDAQLILQALDSMKEFGASRAHMDRQTFADMCQTLLPRALTHEPFAEELDVEAAMLQLLEALVGLSADPAAVVRSRAAQALARILESAAGAQATSQGGAACMSAAQAADAAKGALLKMQQDGDPEVARLAEQAMVHET